MTTATLKDKYDVIIVGSGFSGIVAASRLAEADLDILVVDENLHIGGQLLRKIPESLGENAAYHPDYTKKIGYRFIESCKRQKIQILNRTRVLGIYPDNRILLEIEETSSKQLSFETILMATGARERFLPFKGWTLPGVVSTGLLQVMMKSNGVLPARNMVIGGSGLFLYAAAYEFLKNKGTLLGLYEQTGMLGKIKMVPTLLGQVPKMVEGVRYMSKIVLSGVIPQFRRRVVEARGNGCLEEVVVARTDAEGHPVVGSEKIIKADGLAVGYGFVPNIELPQLAGCPLEYLEERGGWVVKVDDQMRGNGDHVYCAGEPTGIGGAFKSITEGEIAALSILNRFGKVAAADFQTKLAKLIRERDHHLQFGKYFNSLYQVTPRMLLDVPDEVIVCRCEDIQMGELRQAVKDGYTTPSALKVAVRSGMGNCQGRTCGPVIYDLMSLLTGKPHEEAGAFSVRPPVKPATIGSMSQFE